MTATYETENPPAAVTVERIERGVELAPEVWGDAPFPGGGPLRWTILHSAKTGVRVVLRSHTEGQADVVAVFEKPDRAPSGRPRWAMASDAMPPADLADWHSLGHDIPLAFLPARLERWLDEQIEESET